MICESCHQNLATVHLTEIVQKQKKETHLCEECAKSKNLPGHTAPLSAKDLVGLAQKVKSMATEAPAPVPAELATPCASCGMTFADFRQSGRLGCHDCYDAFKRGLIPLLEKIHGCSPPQHTGRVPTRIGARMERQKLISAFQKELSQAVEREEYEKAAQLRDKIRGLEQTEQVNS
jgi:protein arginine kinase activator